MLFVDYQRAFDSIGRAWIWGKLKARGLPSKLLNIIKEGYEDISCRVLHEGQLSDLIKTSSGVRQGCLLSPLMFKQRVFPNTVLTEWFVRSIRKVFTVRFELSI